MLDGCTPWPDDVAERYRAGGYWRGETLAGLPGDWARRFGERSALVCGTQRISFSQLAARVDRLAAGFRRTGIVAGDRVVVQLPNVPEFVLVVFALMRIDAKPVFSLISHRASEIRHLCQLSEARGYVVPALHQGFDHVRLAAEVALDCPALRSVFVADPQRPLPTPTQDAVDFLALDDVDADPGAFPSPAPSDVAFFLLSGGTTALPKLIPRTHDDYAYQTRCTADIDGLTADDVYLAALPVEFNFTWGCPGVVGTLRSGGTVVLVPDPSPTTCFDAIEAERVTVTSLVPALVQLWLDALDADMPDGGPPAALASLRLLQVGGARLHRDIAEQVRPALGCRLQQVFGMAEGLLTFTRDDDPPDTVTGTQGRPVSPADEIRVVDEDGDVLQPGRVGELLTRGPYTLRGYYRAPEHNARAFTEDGFYRTGDLVSLTADGHLVVEGRIKDVIIRGGNKISAGEVEGHLLAHPAVDRAAVVAIPDEYLGERICAFVTLDPEHPPPTLRDLRQSLHERGIADYKLPDRLEVVTELPLTGLGKVDKKALTLMAAGAAVAHA